MRSKPSGCGKSGAIVGVPIAQGELFNRSVDWRDLISGHLIDYIRVHISQIGGITPARKLQMFAEQYGVRTAWHGPGDMSPIAHAANVHIDLAAMNFGVQEWSGIEPPNFVIQDLKGPKGALLEVFPGFRNLGTATCIPTKGLVWGWISMNGRQLSTLARTR